eukprot:Gb_02500 [translate_table: standard]
MMALSYLTWKHSGYSFAREQKDGFLLFPSSSHAKISSYSLLGRRPRTKGRGRKIGSLTWALNKLKVADSAMVENEQIQGIVEIPVSCYQILGVPDGSVKDQVVKAAMELKAAEIEEGYTSSVVQSRQEVLMDVRDKLLFEPEFAGNAREHVLPRSSLRLPWSWLPATMCLLQEGTRIGGGCKGYYHERRFMQVGEDKIVLEIGRAAMQKPNAKPYVHDILLAMALAECSIARTGFERGIVSESFKALARAQLLLRSKRSLAKMNLLVEIEAALEELAPTCTLEHLSMPRTPENAERREGALAALRELLRQGLEAESSCAVRDWPVFLNQAIKKLLAVEIVDLLPWETLAFTRKNNYSSEAQQQRIVIDFNCFYRALLAHIALGFSSRRPEMIEKAKKIAKSLEMTEAVNLSFEGIVCSTLLQEGKDAVTEDRKRLGLNGNSVTQQPGQDDSCKGDRGIIDFSMAMLVLLKVGTVSYARRRAEIDQEKWLKDTALAAFADTRDCTPSLGNYFGGTKKTFISNWRKKDVERPLPVAVQRSSSNSTLPQVEDLRSDDPVQALAYSSSAMNLPAGDQFLPPNPQSHSLFSKSKSTPSLKWKQNVVVPRKRPSGNWWAKGKMAGNFFVVAVLAGSAFATLKLCLQSRPMICSCENYAAQLDHSASTSLGAVNHTLGCLNSTAQGHRGNSGRRITMAIARSLLPFTEQHQDEDAPQNAWPVNDLSTLIGKSTRSVFHKRQQMAFSEAEGLVRQWQSIKAEALGPNHEIHRLSDILSEPMLSQWQALAESAKSGSCFWRFVLLRLSIVHAEVLSDDIGWEIAEVEAVLEEAAELVDDSRPKNPNYYREAVTEDGNFVEVAFNLQCRGLSEQKGEEGNNSSYLYSLCPGLWESMAAKLEPRGRNSLILIAGVVLNVGLILGLACDIESAMLLLYVASLRKQWSCNKCFFPLACCNCRQSCTEQRWCALTKAMARLKMLYYCSLLSCRAEVLTRWAELNLMEKLEQSSS